MNTRELAEQIIDTLAEAGYIAESVAEHPDRFEDVVETIQPLLEQNT